MFHAECLGHFLIPPEKRVCNDVQSQGMGSIQVITGPNMAGKSTFLKTIGVNMVLGLAGAPVCARSCRMSAFRLYTSMKVSDSLDKHLSLFYAELQRLKKILEQIVSGEPVFYLLDEMLKGTNALDRQAGALALLRQLVGYHASGVVATHDLELTKLDDAFPEKIRNFHFDGYVEGDQLRFDYKLKPGKCESFNALILMRKIGIDI
jgi:DNA mismatch repair ATPase MutS